jgi:basic amino acid/polyamine antiporter, APA family
MRPELMSSLFVRKPVETLANRGPVAHSSPGLPRTLGVFSLTCFGVGCTVGAGIFVLTGTVAAEHAGPAVALSFILASIACALAGLCYAEFAALAPVAGSAYTYAYATLGEIVAWVIGWCLILEYLFACALVAIGWSGYIVSLAGDMGLSFPTVLVQAPVDAGAHGLVMTGACANIPAVLVTLGCTLLLLVGTQVSARINDVIVMVNVVAIVVIGVAGLARAHWRHWVPFVPHNTGHFGAFGLSGVLTGAAIVFYAYVGFDAVSTMAQETREPQRTVPRGLIASLCVCTVLYVLIALMITGLVDYHSLAVPDPVHLALAAGGPALAWAKTLVGVVIGMGLISTLLVTLLGQVRIFYAMASDGLLPACFASLQPRSLVPHIGTWVTGVAAAIIAGVFPLKLLGELISIGTLLAFAIVCLGILVLRIQRPDLPRPFRVPGYPWTPIAGIAVCLALMASLPRGTWIRLVVWLAVGLVVYRVYGWRHSRLRNQQAFVEL